MPEPKTFKLRTDGSLVYAPKAGPRSQSVPRLHPAAWPGAPLEPTGNPMLDGVGPAAYAERADVPDLTLDGHPKIVPMRVATEFTVEARDPDPRGMEVVGADGEVGGVVTRRLGRPLRAADSLPRSRGVGRRRQAACAPADQLHPRQGPVSSRCNRSPGGSSRMSRVCATRTRSPCARKTESARTTPAVTCMPSRRDWGRGYERERARNRVGPWPAGAPSGRGAHPLAGVAALAVPGSAGFSHAKAGGLLPGTTRLARRRGFRRWPLGARSRRCRSVGYAACARRDRHTRHTRVVQQSVDGLHGDEPSGW